MTAFKTYRVDGFDQLPESLFEQVVSNEEDDDLEVEQK